MTTTLQIQNIETIAAPQARRRSRSAHVAACGLLLLLGSMRVAAQPVSPVEEDIGPLTVEMIGIIGSPFGLHQAGNMEIKTSGFPDPPPRPPTLPPSLPWPPATWPTSHPLKTNCDRTYVTTKKSAESLQQMINLLTIAQTNMQPVYLRITNDPRQTAYPGRCSLVSVGIGQ